MMKILSWNCCGNFKEKIAFIMAFDWDIAIIQECENPETIKVRNKKEEAKKKHFSIALHPINGLAKVKIRGSEFFLGIKNLKWMNAFPI